MTNEEMLKDIERMNNESIASIKRSMETFREISKQYEDKLPENDAIEIESIMKDTLKTAEQNSTTIRTIINDNAYTDAMGSVLPQ